MITAIAKTEVWGGKGRSEQWNGGGVRENDFPLNHMYHNLPLHIGLAFSLVLSSKWARFLFLGTKQVGSKANFPNSSPSLVWKRARFEIWWSKTLWNKGIQAWTLRTCLSCYKTERSLHESSHPLLHNASLKIMSTFRRLVVNYNYYVNDNFVFDAERACPSCFVFSSVIQPEHESL